MRKHQNFFRWLTRWSLIAFRDVGLTLWAGKSIMSRTIFSDEESGGKSKLEKANMGKTSNLYEKSSLWVIKCSKRFVMVQRPPWHPVGFYLQDSPPPPEIQDRVIQREDDTPETSLWYILGSVLVSPAATRRYHSFDKDIGQHPKKATVFHEGIASYACRWVGSSLHPWSLGFVAGSSHTTRTGREMGVFPKSDQIQGFLHWRNARYSSIIAYNFNGIYIISLGCVYYIDDAKGVSNCYQEEIGWWALNVPGVLEDNDHGWNMMHPITLYSTRHTSMKFNMDTTSDAWEEVRCRFSQLAPQERDAILDFCGDRVWDWILGATELKPCKYHEFHP